MLDQRDLDAPAAPERPRVLIRAEAVALAYDGPVVLDGLRFSVTAGQRVGVLGPNGAGKTTLFRALWGELAPVAGALSAPDRVGVVAQTERSRLDFPVSAHDVALMGTLSTLPWWRRPGRADRSRALDALHAVDLADRAAERFGELSGGQRQRVLIARALVQQASVVVLDEPYSGLDAASAERLDRLLVDLAAQGRGLVISSHDVRQARAWDRVLLLNRRQVAFGPPAEVLTPGLLTETYGNPGGAPW
ncbi:MAG: metal ABC transporter ATP-binding protein [Solirubrobacteraceae bacterium]